MGRTKAPDFTKTEEQLRALHHEMGVLSRQKPNDAVNSFKLGLINEVLEGANKLLKEPYRAFATFTIFDAESMPTNSDVVMVLAQYQKCLSRQDYDERYGRD